MINTRIFKSRFFYLLCSLILYFIGTALFSGDQITNYINSSFFSFFIIFCIYPFLKSKKILISAIILGLLVLTMHWIIVFYEHNEYLFISLYIGCILFLMLITRSVINAVTQHKQITFDSLIGAICGYFLIGFTWTFLYLLIYAINNDAFSFKLANTSIHELTQHFFYFSFTTMTTLGFGDVLPVSNIARTCAWLEAVTGQIYLAVWISQLVGLRITQKVSIK